MAFYKAVFLVFLVLKLAAIGPVAGWSWWWITSPLWCVFIPTPKPKKQ
jgi:small Trp-rich protein